MCIIIKHMKIARKQHCSKRANSRYGPGHRLRFYIDMTDSELAARPIFPIVTVVITSVKASSIPFSNSATRNRRAIASCLT